MAMSCSSVVRGDEAELGFGVTYNKESELAKRAKRGFRATIALYSFASKGY
jgi:hypothetical protein